MVCPSKVIAWRGIQSPDLAGPMTAPINFPPLWLYNLADISDKSIMSWHPISVCLKSKRELNKS